MQAVRAMQTLEVAVDRPWLAWPVPMKEPVVGHDIQHAVPRHPATHPLQGRKATLAQGHQQRGDQPQGHQVQVIGFEHAQLRLMVRAVQPPAPAMHDVLVSQRANALHGHQGAEQYGEIEQHGTVRVMAREGARVPIAGAFFHAGVTGCRPIADEAIVMFLPLTWPATGRKVRGAILHP
ncbi:hypothetical protein D3C81_1494870 [compost metagenome]